MWTRKELKKYAKDFLRKHYWKAFIVCLIFTLITGGGANNSGNDEYVDPPQIESRESVGDDNLFERGADGIIRIFGSYSSFPLWVIGTSFVVFLVIALVIVSFLVGPLIIVGKDRFFLRSFEGDVKISHLFSTFNRNEFWGIFKCMFITGLKNLLWFLLLIIPGIVKAYEYSMVPYLLTEDTNLTSREAIEISRNLTEGHKWDLFVLDLSFLGWNILGTLLFGIGTFFVTPYYEATWARLYNVLSGNDDDNNMNEDYDVVYE